MTTRLQCFFSLLLLAPGACLSADTNTAPASPPGHEMSWIRTSADKTHFVCDGTARPFVPWGFNYDHDQAGRLLDDYWSSDWPKVTNDFREMKKLGANVVRVHLQLCRFMKSPVQPDEYNLARLGKLVQLAQETGLYLDVTGLGCYHRQDVPAWYDAMDESNRWAVQTRFWRAVAGTCKDSPAIFCYDLMNEPVPSGDRPGDWLPGKPLGGSYFVQRLTTDMRGRTDKEVAKEWIAEMCAAIRQVDKRHMITVGLVPWEESFGPGAKSAFRDPEVSAPLDFLCVHYYPRAGKLNDDLAILKLYDLGKPLVIEEIFPLSAGIETTGQFIRRSRAYAVGWISFYWGITPREYENEPGKAAAVTGSWLRHFIALRPEMVNDENRSFDHAASIDVDPARVTHPASRYLTGACLEDVNHEVYGGLYSQMIFGESFQEPPASGFFEHSGAWFATNIIYSSTNARGAVSGMWTPEVTGTATGQYSTETSNAFVGTQSQRITFSGGSGQVAIANRGLNRRGMNFLAGHEYDGCLDARADTPTTLTVALESANGKNVYAQTNLQVTAGHWQHLTFAMTPASADSHGRFVIALAQPGSVVVGYAFLEPGAWGRLDGLPVRKDVANGLIKEGITVLRYGGSMVNAPGYRWKNMIGPRDSRPPYTGTWYPYSTDGWGIPDFLNFCEAAGFLGVPDFNINETPRDMADFMQYVNGPTNTVWGARRAADGHPAPYRLKYLELGNEERVDAAYYKKFEALARAIWAADRHVVIVVGDFAYSQVITNPFSFTGAASGITTLAAQQQILHLAHQCHRPVWFDVHVWDDGPAVDPSLTAMFSYDTALAQIAGGADYKVVVFELNANHHNQARALGNALAINAAERDGRLPIVSSANCLQVDGENDNGWNQGLLFLNGANVWLQPPGYVTQMYSESYQPLEVWSTVSDPNNDLDVSAQRNHDGNRLVLHVVNRSSLPEPAAINLSNFTPTRSFAHVQVLSAELSAINTPQTPRNVAPVSTICPCHPHTAAINYTFAPDSVTILSFQGQSR